MRCVLLMVLLTVDTVSEVCVINGAAHRGYMCVINGAAHRGYSQ